MADIEKDVIDKSWAISVVEPKPVQNGFFRDNIWNSMVVIRGKRYRERAEVLILKGDEVLLRKKSDGTYKIPGGSSEPDHSLHDQAIQEAQEEVNITTTNLEYYGSYQKMYTKGEEYDGYICHVFVGMYSKPYNGYVKKADRDIKMLKESKFYKIDDVFDMLIPEHQNAVRSYLNLLSEAAATSVLYHGSPNRHITLKSQGMISETSHFNEMANEDMVDMEQDLFGNDFVPFFRGVQDYDEYFSENSNYKFELTDTNVKLQFSTSITESTSSTKLYPVYVMIMHSSTILSNVIKNVTQSNFSHSSISFDSSMHKMYSFGRKRNTNPFIGAFKSEDIRDEFFTSRDIPYALYVVPSTEDEIKAMKKRLDYFIRNSTKFQYDFTGLFKNYLGIADNPEYKWFCSRFVSDIINAGRPSEKPYVVEPSLMRPEDFRKTNFAIYVTGGLLDTYNQKTVDYLTRKILREEEFRRKQLASIGESVYDFNQVSEFTNDILSYKLATMDESAIQDFTNYIKSFKVRFDNNGNIIMTQREYKNLDAHFHNSLKMLKAAEKSDNRESIKEELYKIHYMIELITENYLVSSAAKMADPKMKKKMIDLRSVMLNVFQRYLKYVTIREPGYNFQKGYDNSKYGKVTKIPGKAVKTIGKTIVTALM